MDTPSDVLLQLCVRMDVEAIRSLSLTPLWLRLRDIVSTSYFWYLRTQYELEVELTNLEGDWKDVYYKLDRYVGVPTPIRDPIRNKESELLIRVLLELGYNPNTPGIFAYAVKLGYDGIVRALLSDKRTIVPAASELIPLLPKYYTQTPSLVESLLADSRFVLSDLDAVALVNHLGDMLTYAINSGSIRLVRLLLNSGQVLCEFDYTTAISNGNLEMVKLLFPYQTESVNSVSMASAISQSNVETVQFVIAHLPSDTSVLSTALRFSVQDGNLPVVRLLLFDERTDTSTALFSVLSGSAVNLEMADAILSDTRTDISSSSLLSREDFLRLEPLIARRVISAYRASNKKGGLSKHYQAVFYSQFLRVLIIKHPTPLQAADWLIAQRSPVVGEAARSIVDGVPVMTDLSVSALYGYLLCFTYHLTLDETWREMEADMRTETKPPSRRGQKRVIELPTYSSDLSTELASRLIGAQLGADEPFTYTAQEYDDAIRVLFDL